MNQTCPPGVTLEQLPVFGSMLPPSCLHTSLNWQACAGGSKMACLVRQWALHGGLCIHCLKLRLQLQCPANACLAHASEHGP